MNRSVLLVPAVALALALAGCGGGSSFEEGFKAGQQQAAATPAASAAPVAPSSPAANPSARVTIPDGLDGTNGAIALDKLRKAGLTNIQPASQDEADKLVVNPANWTVTKVEPSEGTDVAAADTVVVTMTKE